MIEIYQSNTSPSISDVIAVNGVPFNLTGATVRFRMREKNSATLTVDAPAVIVDASAGVVRYDWISTDTALLGDYLGWWHITLASGNVQDAPEFAIRIISHNDRDYDLCTLFDVRLAMEFPEDDIRRDELMLTYISTASDAIMREYEREFAPPSTAVTRTFRWNFGRNVIDLAPWDLRSVTAVSVDTTNVSPTVVTDYQLLPVSSRDGLFSTLVLSPYVWPSANSSYLYGYSTVAITGNWGFAAIPSVVRQACVLTVQAWMSRSMGNVAPGPEILGINPLSPDLPANYSIPAAARRLLQSFRRSPVL